MMGIRELFHQWTTKTLGGSNKLSVSDYELITDRIHVDVENLKAMELKNTVGQATNTQSQSGPIPGTMKITTTAISYAETGAATGYKTMFVPNPGEVWLLVAASSSMAGGSSGQSIIMGDSEPADLTTAPTTYVLVSQESSSGNPYWSPLLYGAPLYFDENIIPVLQVYSQTTGESSTFYGAFIRVR